MQPTPFLYGARQSRFRLFAWIAAAYNVAVILWGAFVRASGSGAGCGNHWPLCNGVVLPRNPGTATLIELTHRLSSGIVLILAVVLAAWAYRTFPQGHRVRRAAALALAFTLSEALIGAGLVVFEQVARNASATRVFSLSVHLINTFVLLACLTLTAWWAGEGRTKPWRVKGRAAAALAVTLLVGVSGAIDALGDTLFPSTSLNGGLAGDFSSTSHFLLRLRVLHPLFAAAAGAWLLYLAFPSLTAAALATRRLAWLLSASVGAQWALGMMNLALLAPIWLQLSHLLLADVLWILLILLLAERAGEMRGRPLS